MSKSSSAKGRSLASLPTEVQTLVYRYCFPDTWTFHVHSFHLDTKISDSGYVRPQPSIQEQPWKSCDNPNHSKNPSRALLLTCRTIHDLARPILHQSYGGTISICSDTVEKSEAFMPDSSACTLARLFHTNDLLRTKTRALSMNLDHIKTSFANFLWDQFQYGPEGGLLPNLKEIILKDDIYYSAYDYRGPRTYNPQALHEWDLYGGYDMEDASFVADDKLFKIFCDDLVQRRFDQCLLPCWDYEDEFGHRAPTDQYRWIPRSDTFVEENNWGSCELPVFYLMRLRIDEIEDQAYEVRFLIRKELPPPPTIPIIPYEHERKLHFAEYRSLTREEDSAINWWEAVNPDSRYWYESDDEEWLSYEIGWMEEGRAKKLRAEHHEWYYYCSQPGHS